MKQRVITSIGIIAAVIPLFFFKQYFMALLMLVAILVTWELNDLILSKKNPLLLLAIFGLIVGFGFDYIAEANKLIVASSFLILFVLINLIYNEIKFNDLSLVYTISLLLGFALSALIFLYNTSILLVVYVILVNYGSDAGAYLVGSKFGSRKLAPKISPNKTIEGSLGGIAFGAILGIGFGQLFLKDHMSFGILLIVSLILPMISQMGDLFFSSIKRLYSKKDFGKIFPGHGGVLDRIDSLVFSLLFMIIFIRLGFLGVFLWKI